MAWSSLSRHQRGYGASWDRLRQRVIRRDKWQCQECARQGTPGPGNEVDHIIPKSQGGTDDPSNLQLLCRAHHKQKTQQESNGSKPKGCSADGIPTDPGHHWGWGGKKV